MNELLGRVVSFGKTVFHGQHALYSTLSQGQSPKALMISCADSRIVPEHIMQAQPGDLFVCRNAGNIVPPFALQTGGVSATVEYAVAVLGVNDIIVCGHSDCGAMKGLAGDPAALAAIPTVANWLKHGAAARQIVDQTYPDLTDAERIRALSLENVVAQLAHLRTHPSVAAGIAQGKIALHGWFVDIHDGTVLALDGTTGRFRPLDEGGDFPVAQPAAPRQASDVEFMAAAE
ncbi:carbonic anhydrase [Sphingomonas melonis]|uniref:Carbonic anhydrase n=1 Tax=Sphingomonas melonis TaxID=152682 RepID=A0A7Y9FKC0_9SPHN|nr:carbonic anhydrase [Sphingomonas melonis]